MPEKLTIPLEAVGKELYDAVASGRVAHITDGREGGKVLALLLPVVPGSVLADWLDERARLRQQLSALRAAARQALDAWPPADDEPFPAYQARNALRAALAASNGEGPAG